MLRRVAALAAVPVLAASALLVPPAAGAPGSSARCGSVPLKFTKSYVSGGEHWQTTASLKVYDLCAKGNIRGKVYLRGTGGTQESSLSPYKVTVNYKRELDTAFTGSGVALKRLARQGNGWRPYSVTTRDIRMERNVGWLIAIRVRWTVHAGGKNYSKSVTCDRVYTTGNKAYYCG